MSVTMTAHPVMTDDSISLFAIGDAAILVDKGLYQEDKAFAMFLCGGCDADIGEDGSADDQGNDSTGGDFDGMESEDGVDI